MTLWGRLLSYNYCKSKGGFYMNFFLPILGSTVLSLILFMIQPFIAAIVLSGIVVGCSLRGLYLLKEIHEKLIPKEDKVKAAVRLHLEEQNRIE
mgnify:CR=1 FL=1